MNLRPAAVAERRTAMLLAALAVTVAGCREITIVPTCSEELGVRPVGVVLESPDDPCREWVEDLHIRAARHTDGGASGVLWTRRTQPGTGLLLTMTLWTQCRAERAELPEGEGCAPRWSDPQAMPGRTLVHLAHPDGGRPDLAARATFHLFEPEQPDPEQSPELAPLSSGFVVHVLDGQTFSSDDLLRGAEPEPLTNLPLEIEDPSGSTLSAPTWAEARPGSRALAFGYPHSGQEEGRLQATVVRVLGTAEARHALSSLPASDVESQVPHDPEVEIVARGEVVIGMGGGGVFDRRGRLVAILVRAFTPPGGEMHVRAVRMSFITRTMADTLAALPEAERARVAPYLPLP